MTRTLPCVYLLLVCSGAAVCQTPAVKPKFDFADVHFSPREQWVRTVANWTDGDTLGGDRYDVRRATLLDLIRIAYNVDAKRIFGGPTWIDYDRYEIVAKTRPGTRQATLRLMLQALLDERFHLVVKADTQPVDGFRLSIGKGGQKLKPAADSGDSPGCHGTMRRDPAGSYTDFQCRNMTMEEFAIFLKGPALAPVEDGTGLHEAWDMDFTLKVGSLASVPNNGGVLDAMEKLGLKLEPAKVPQPVLNVVSAEEQPAANLPGTTEALAPSAAPEFEVASVKPCDRENSHISSSARWEPGGRVTATCMSVGILIADAWKVDYASSLLGMPKWRADEGQISIAAKAPVGIPQDRDTLYALLRALLTERYRMAVHYEERPADAYTLLATKPKLTKADPTGRTGCERQIQPTPGTPLIQYHLICRNMTMAQFVEQVQANDPGTKYPVADGTGITGAWDFTLDYDSSGTALFQNWSQRMAAADDGASDPIRTISFAEAIQRQIGLKLELQKRPERVLVIDHMDSMPTEN